MKIILAAQDRSVVSMSEWVPELSIHPTIDQPRAATTTLKRNMKAAKLCLIKTMDVSRSKDDKVYSHALLPYCCKN